jgi:segregation and condensation protein B
MAFAVATPVFEGPFDLLLHLILREQVDIYEVSLTRIVDAYLEEIERLQVLDLDVATEFLLIAATLVELKARRLLPGRDDVDLDDELALWEERDLLLARLLECKTFKDVAGVFSRLAEEADRSFGGPQAPTSARRGDARPARWRHRQASALCISARDTQTDSSDRPLRVALCASVADAVTGRSTSYPAAAVSRSAGHQWPGRAAEGSCGSGLLELFKQGVIEWIRASSSARSACCGPVGWNPWRRARSPSATARVEMTMNEIDTETVQAIEAIVMVAVEPVAPDLLAQLLEQPTAVIERLCVELAAAYDEAGHGFQLVKVAGGYRYQSHAELAPYVERFLLDGQRARMSAAALETLAIVAYKQPLSRGQIASIRGVDPDGVLRTLQARGYVTEVARDTGPGQAIMYGTTPSFLEKLGLNSLSDLPPIADFVPARWSRRSNTASVSMCQQTMPQLTDRIPSGNWNRRCGSSGREELRCRRAGVYRKRPFEAGEQAGL